jgi:hypothetical protein
VFVPHALPLILQATERRRLAVEFAGELKPAAIRDAAILSRDEQD